MSTCPHCNGASGFEYRMTMITSRFGEWGNDVDEETDIKRVETPKTVTCIDCEKRVKWHPAHGLDDHAAGPGDSG